MIKWYEKNSMKKQPEATTFRLRLGWKQLIPYLFLVGVASIPLGFLSGYLLGYIGDTNCFEGSCGLAAWGLAPTAIPTWFGSFAVLFIFLRSRPKLFWGVCGAMLLFDLWFVFEILTSLNLFGDGPI